MRMGKETQRLEEAGQEGLEERIGPAVPAGGGWNRAGNSNGCIDDAEGATGRKWTVVAGMTEHAGHPGTVERTRFSKRSTRRAFRHVAI